MVIRLRNLETKFIMRNLNTLIYLFFIATLNVSCVEKKATEKAINQSELVNTSKTDTLKFT